MFAFRLEIATFFEESVINHEHLTESTLINMHVDHSFSEGWNGRLYDPLVGRFLNPDNFVQQSGNIQSYNRYSYCLNNPLKYTDPSGQKWYNFLSNTMQWINDNTTHLRQWMVDAEIPAFGVNVSIGSDGYVTTPGLEAYKTSQGLIAQSAKYDTELNGWRYAANSGGDAQSLFLLGLGLTADGAEGAANLFQTSNAGVKAAAVRNNLPTTQIDKIMGNTSKFATGAKWAGRGVIVVGAGISIYQGYDAYTQGDMTGVSKAGLDLGVGLGAAAIGGIPGVLLYGGYMLMMQPPHGGTGYQHPNVFLNDNTYVAPPVVPGF